MTTDNKLAAIQPQEGGITRASLSHTREQLVLLEEFVKDVLRPKQDFGIIPGTDKPTLLKPGASNIISAFNCHAEPHIDTEQLKPYDDDGTDAFASYTVHVDVVSNQTGNIVARGFGECNSYEKKYRYRVDQRRCPECGAASIIKGKSQYGGGWFCWQKKGGCGAKFPDGDETVESQMTGQIENPDPLDQANTYLKMAIKRAEVDAALRLPGVARFFTQDVEDIMGAKEDDEEPAVSPTTQPPKPKSKPQPTRPEPQITEAQLRATVEDEGMTWEHFEIQVLGKSWGEFIKVKGATPSIALVRWETWKKDHPPISAQQQADLDSEAGE